MAAVNQEIDESLYSRQIYVMGMEAMKKLANASVLITGMGGLGAEIAKNIILAGVKNVTLHDDRNASIEDLASQFYLRAEHVGQNRALASRDQFASLNDYVTVTASNSALTESFLQPFDVICVTDWRSESELLRLSTYAKAQNKKLIFTDVRGVFGYAFNFFGNEFTVYDPKGEQPSRFLISFITNADEGVVTVSEDDLHNLSDGDRVLFEEVEGMSELNGREFPVKVINARQFSIGDTTKFGKYTSMKSSGYGNQIFVPTKHQFMDFKEAITKPEFVIFDFAAFGRDQQVLLGFLSLQRYADKHQDKPLQVNMEEIFTIAQEINTEVKLVDEVDKKIIETLASEAPAVISPSAAVFGGIVGQEIMKALTGKFTPIKQFLAMGYVEALPSKVQFTLKGDRYDPYRIVFGDAQQEAMSNLRYFMIGAGALGCEILKNWALMGVASSGEGKVYVTDMDTIERSNLSRQFLFRNSDIGALKSAAAAKAANGMNSSIRIEAHSNRLGPESASIYNDDFFESLSGVCNALDNVQTRLFADQMCVFYKKPLLESGTLGPKAHYQMIIPNMTESYSSTQDPPEKGIPQCTLHNFPSNIDHCCMWARDTFTGFFERGPSTVNRFIQEDNFAEDLNRTDPGELAVSMKIIQDMIVDEDIKSFDDCVKWARMKFDELFDHKIKDLISNYPEDYVTESGLPFWTGSKRFPAALSYDPTNEFHAEFVNSAATIAARIYGIKPTGNAHTMAAKYGTAWKPSGVKISLDENAAPTQLKVENPVDVAHQMQHSRNHKLLNVERFEKDDDSNGHMDFVAAAANLRAMNYRIQPQSKLEIKRIAGKIIPAIATTTAMICGLVALEMYKVHSLETKRLDDYRSGFINLAISMFALSEPAPCKKQKCSANDKDFTLWDTWVIDGDLTVQQFIDKAAKDYNVVVDMITVGSFLVYMSFMNPPEKKAARLASKFTDILVKEGGQEPLADGQNYLGLVALCVDDDFNDVATPQFVLKVK